MSKAFTKESDSGDDDDDVALPALPRGTKNYLTPQGYARLRSELMGLLDEERPKVVEVVSWAAKNGDRSENGDYLYGKKRLREIDRRIRFLTKRLDIAEVVDPSAHYGHDQVFFGATVTYANHKGDERTRALYAEDSDNVSASVRAWAVEHPHQYALLYGSPVPGYEAPLDTVVPGTTVRAVVRLGLADAGEHEREPRSGFPVFRHTDRRRQRCRAR